MKGENCFKNRGAKAGTVIIPDSILKLSKTVKTKAENKSAIMNFFWYNLLMSIRKSFQSRKNNCFE